MTETIDQATERRTNSELLLTLVNQILDSQKKLADSQSKLDDKLTKHMTEETQELAEAMAQMMKVAFPGGDPDGHRRHHELVIKQAEERAAFWEKMRYELVKWGLFGFLGWASYALWKAFLQGPLK